MSLIHGIFINNNKVSVHMSSPKKLILDPGAKYEGTVDSYYVDIGTISKYEEPKTEIPIMDPEPPKKRRGRKPGKIRDNS